jgi:hypothetical protein
MSVSVLTRAFDNARSGANTAEALTDWHSNQESCP